jgi:hypothetical protein
MTDADDGAIDSTFDESERTDREQLQSRIDEHPTEVQAGDVVIDMVEDRPLYVRRKAAESAVEYYGDADFDLVTYKSHKWLPITPDDAVFDCVFLPTHLNDIPSRQSDKSYTYPRGRLARVPIEYLWDSSTRPQFDRRVDLAAAILDEANRFDGDAAFGTVLSAIGGAFGETVAESAAAKFDE